MMMLSQVGGLGIYLFVRNKLFSSVDVLGLSFECMTPVDLSFVSDPGEEGDYAMNAYVTYNEAYPFDSPSGFVPNAYLGKCGCIRNITVVGHGQKYGNGLVQFTAGFVDLSEDNGREEISGLFSGVRFCDKCHIIMKACWLGSSQVLRNNIQRKTGCTVDLYDRPTNTLPFVDPFVGLWYWLKHMMEGK